MVHFSHKETPEADLRAAEIRAYLAQKRASRWSPEDITQGTSARVQKTITIPQIHHSRHLLAMNDESENVEMGLFGRFKKRVGALLGKANSRKETIYNEENAFAYTTEMFIKKADESKVYEKMNGANIYEHHIEQWRARFQSWADKTERTMGNFIVRFKAVATGSFPKQEGKTPVAVVFLDPKTRQIIGRSAGYLDDTAYKTQYILIHSVSGKKDPICMGEVSSGTVRLAA